MTTATLPMTDLELVTLVGLPKASPFQTAVIRHVANQITALIAGGKAAKSIRNLMVEATAGSGKTTTTVAVARLFRASTIKRLTGKEGMGLKVLAIAFGKKIQLELDRRMEFNNAANAKKGIVHRDGVEGEAKTLNALGHQIYSRWYWGLTRQNPKLDDTKRSGIMRSLYDRVTMEEYGANVKALCGYAISAGYAPSLSKKPKQGLDGKEDTDENLQELVDHYLLDIKPSDKNMVFRMVREVLSADFNTEEVISFEDQRWFAVVKRTAQGQPLPAPVKYDGVLGDEAQDFSKLDIALLQKVMKRGVAGSTFMMFVGDREQSLYGFRGADSQAIPNLTTGFDCESLPLSICYRCATSIVAEAQQYSDRIQPFAGSPKGIVKTLGEFNADTFKPGDLVVCRNNAPAVSMAFSLIKARKPVGMLGRDLGRGLITVIRNVVGKRRNDMVSFEGRTVNDLRDGMEHWVQVQTAAILRKNPDDLDGVQSVEDKYDTVMVFVNDNTDGKIETVVREIEDLFDTKSDSAEVLDPNKIMFSSVHRSKGLESKRVFILNPSLFFPARVRQGSWQWEQEKNVVFVAITRAMLELYFIDSERFV